LINTRSKNICTKSAYLCNILDPKRIGKNLTDDQREAGFLYLIVYAECNCLWEIDSENIKRAFQDFSTESGKFNCFLSPFTKDFLNPLSPGVKIFKN